MKSVNKRITIGTFWMVGFRQVDRVIGLISTAILARLLVPEDFGLVVYATTFVGIVNLFFQFGFETVLIRDQDANRDSYDTAWTLEIAKGLILSIVLVVGAAPIALFFNEPQVKMVLYFLAVIPLLDGLKNIGIVDFQKKMKFRKEFFLKFSARVVSATVTIILAYQLKSYLALVYGMVLNSILILILSYTMSKYRPRLNLSQTSRVFGFSKWLLVQSFIHGLNNRIPVLVIGRFYEAQTLAFYSIGHELSNLATGEIASPIRRALFPGIALIANDEKRMVETIIAALGVIAFIGLPATIGIAVTAPVFVPVLLGDNWGEIIPVVQILAINGAALALYSNSHVVFYAMDKPRIAAYVNIFRLFLLMPSVLLLAPDYGAIGAAWALSITNVIVTVSEYFLFYRIVQIRVQDIISVIWRSIISTIAMGIATYYCLNMLMNMEARFSLIIELLLTIAVGIFCYALIIFLLWLIAKKPKGAESYILGTFQGCHFIRPLKQGR